MHICYGSIVFLVRYSVFAVVLLCRKFPQGGAFPPERGGGGGGGGGCYIYLSCGQSLAASSHHGGHAPRVSRSGARIITCGVYQAVCGGAGTQFQCAANSPVCSPTNTQEWLGYSPAHRVRESHCALPTPAHWTRYVVMYYVTDVTGPASLFSREQNSFRPAIHDQLAGEQSDGGQGLRERSGHSHSL